MELLLLLVAIGVLTVMLTVALVASGRGGVVGTRAAPAAEREEHEAVAVDLLEPPRPVPTAEPGVEPGVEPAVEPGVQTVAPELVVEPAPAPPEAPLSTRERFLRRLSRARTSLGGSVAAIFGRGVSDEAWEELEESLIAADVGVDATLEIVEGLRERARAENLHTGDEALALLKEVLRLELGVADRRLHRRADGPSVWLVTGVNGTGKTTSIGKLAARYTGEGERVVLAAGDTFRAAAADQLELWGKRAEARVVRSEPGADPASVAFDGWQAAKAAAADLLLVDTAGRLQNKSELMAELSKVKRVLEREAGPLDEVLLVLDATTGQNGLSQAKAFLEAVDVSGVVLTKLDTTAKGGIVIAIQRQLGVPVKLVGLGEGVDDLAEFDPDAFVDALFATTVLEVEELGEDSTSTDGQSREV